MLWSLRKNKLLKKVNQSIPKLRNERSVKHNIVIDIIEQCIEKDREAILERSNINPMYTSTLLVSHILRNFWILDIFPEHKKLIKKILS